MLRLSAALAITLLCACKQEPGFDERYKAAQQRVNAKADAIDKELAAAAQSEAATASSSEAAKAPSGSGAALRDP